MMHLDELINQNVKETEQQLIAKAKNLLLRDNEKYHSDNDIEYDFQGDNQNESFADIGTENRLGGFVPI